jgi:hypothetical protein
MKGLPVRSCESIGFPFPLEELTKHYGIAVERSQAAAVFEDGLGKKVGVKTTGSREIDSLDASQFIEERKSAPVTVQPLIQGSEPQNIFSIFQATMRNLAHEFENNPNIAVVDVSLVLHAFADQPQNFQAAVNDLVLSRACRGRQHDKPPIL